MKHTNIIIIFILGIILTGCSAEDILIISTNVTSTTTTNVTYNVTNNITNNITYNVSVNETKFILNFTVEDDTTVTHTICLFNDTCFSTAFIDSTGSSGFNTIGNAGLYNNSLTLYLNDTYVNQYWNDTNAITILNNTKLQNGSSASLSALTITPGTLDVSGTSILGDMRFIESTNINFIQSGSNRVASSWQEFRIGLYSSSNWIFRITTEKNVEVANNLSVNGTGNFAGNVTATNLLGLLHCSNITGGSDSNFCIDDGGGAFTGKINSTQVNSTNSPTSGQVLTYSGSNDQFTWATSSSSSGPVRNTTKATIQTTEAVLWANNTLNDLNITLDANSNYSVACDFLTSSAAATTGEQLAMNFSASTTINVTYQTHSSATVITPYPINAAGTGHAFSDAGSFGTNVQSISWLRGRIATGGSATLLTYRLKSEVAGSPARIVWGSYCEYNKYT